MRPIVLLAALTACTAGSIPPGSGVGSAALTIAPARVEIGSEEVGTVSAPTTFVVTNTGDEDADPSGEAGGDSDAAANFQLLANTCASRTAPLGPGESCGITVAFAPVRTGTATSYISASFPAGTAWATLTGKGTTLPGAELAVSPASLELGSAVVGDTTEHQDLTITNTGTAPSFTLTAQIDDPSFAIDGDTCSDHSVMPGATCTIGVAMTPVTPGPHAATVDITTTPGQAWHVSLAGTGTPP